MHANKSTMHFGAAALKNKIKKRPMYYGAIEGWQAVHSQINRLFCSKAHTLMHRIDVKLNL